MGNSSTTHLQENSNRSSEGSNPKTNPKSHHGRIHLPSSNRKKTVLNRPMQNIREIYTLGKELGRGQFGVTRICTNKSTGEVLACKSISKRSFTCREDVEDVRSEVQIFESISGKSPNIVEFIGAYEDAHSVHLVMQFCSGGELFDRIVSRGKYSEIAASASCKTIVEVIRTCHLNGIMHRDLKPENFLLLNKDDDAPLMAIDFGLSTFFKPGQVFTDLVGSAYYVAPEVLNHYYGPEADIWSAGVILYILLSGAPPFWSDTEEGIFYSIRRDSLDLTSKPWPSISAPAKDLLQKMLNKNPRERITLDEILKHPWICEAPDNPLDSSIVMRLKQFRAMNKLKKVALKFIAETLTEEEISGLKSLFQSMDIDNSGSLTIDELKQGLAKQGTILSQSEANELLKAADADGNGSIDYMEFITATLQMNSMDDDNRLLSAFKYFDKDNSGYITVEELTQALQEHNMGDEETIKSIIAEVDADKDGHIDYEEFVAMMRESTYRP